MKRCAWTGADSAMIKYHDTEWGVPVHNDRKLFEFLILDGFQAGLSWQVILNKRANFRKAFDNFDSHKVAQYTRRDAQRLLRDPGIVRNRSKIVAAIRNAQFFVQVQREFGSFDKYIWQFTGGTTRVNRWKTTRQIPPTSKESDAMSQDLYARGFRFVGSTICYAFMQAAGMVNDHLTVCYRYKEVNRLRHGEK